MYYMFVQVFATYEDIIKISNTKIANKSSQNMIRLIKVVGALVKPKSMTNHSYKPYFVLKEIFHSSPFILI